MTLVYFDSFNPLYEDQIKFFEFICNKYTPFKLVLVPTDDKTTSIDNCYKMLTIRLNLLDVQYRNIIVGHHPGDITTNWRGKRLICQNISRRFRSPIKYIIVDEDMFRKTDWISLMPFNILTFSSKIKILEQHKDKIVMDSEYNSVSQINSAIIRQFFSSGLEISTNICHSDIIEYIKQNCLYPAVINQQLTHLQDQQNITFPPIIAIIGAPGSGKSTLGRFLASKYNYKFYSTGDIYREAEQNGTKEYLILEQCRSNPIKFRCALETFIITYLFNQLKNQTNPVIIEGFKAGNLIQFCKYIIKIEHLLNLETTYSVLKSRLDTRADDRIDKVNINSRINNYFNIYWPELNCEITQLIATKNIIRYTNINANQPIDKLATIKLFD